MRSGKMDEDIEKVLLNIHNFNQDLISLNIKYAEHIEEQNNEIERLNNIINKGIEAINVYQDEKTLSVSYQDLKRIRGILQGNEFDLLMFEKYLQELKGEFIEGSDVELDTNTNN